MYRSRAVSADANSQHNSMTNGGQPSSQLAPQLGGRQVSKKSSWRDLRRKPSQASTRTTPSPGYLMHPPVSHLSPPPLPSPSRLESSQPPHAQKYPNNSSSSNPLTSLYLVAGLPKQTHTWTLADASSIKGVQHRPGAVGSWWRAEILGSNTATSVGTDKAGSDEWEQRLSTKALKYSFTREAEIISSTLQPPSTVHSFSFFLLDQHDNARTHPGRSSTSTLEGTEYHGVTLTVYSHADADKAAAIKKTIEATAALNVSSSHSRPHLAGPSKSGATGFGGQEGSQFWLPYALTLLSKYPIYSLMTDYLRISWAKFAKDVASHSEQMTKILQTPTPRPGEVLRLRIASPPPQTDDDALDLIAALPGHTDMNTGLVSAGWEMWAFFQVLSIDNVLSIVEIALSPNGRVLFHSRHPALLGMAVKTLKYIVELKGWEGMAHSAIHARDVQLLLEDPGPYILAIDTECKHIHPPQPDVLVVDLDINFCTIASPPPNVISHHQAREKIRGKLVKSFGDGSGFFASHGVVPAEFMEAYPGGRLRPICQTAPVSADRVRVPDWYDESRVMQAFQKVLDDKSKKKSFFKRLGSSDSRPKQLSPGERLARSSMRSRANQFVDARDEMEGKLGRLSRRLAYLVHETDQWQARFSEFELLTERLGQEAIDLRAKIEKERRESRRLSGALSEREKERENFRQRLIETERAQADAQTKMSEMQQTVIRIERERDAMLVNIENQLESALVSLDHPSGENNDVISNLTRPDSRHSTRPSSKAGRAKGGEIPGLPPISRGIKGVLESITSEGDLEAVEAGSQDDLSSKKKKAKRFSAMGGKTGGNPMEVLDDRISSTTSDVADKVLAIQMKLDLALRSMAARHSIDSPRSSFDGSEYCVQTTDSPQPTSSSPAPAPDHNNTFGSNTHDTSADETLASLPASSHPFVKHLSVLTTPATPTSPITYVSPVTPTNPGHSTEPSSTPPRPRRSPSRPPLRPTTAESRRTSGSTSDAGFVSASDGEEEETSNVSNASSSSNYHHAGENRPPSVTAFGPASSLCLAPSPMPSLISNSPSLTDSSSLSADSVRTTVGTGVEGRKALSDIGFGEGQKRVVGRSCLGDQDQGRERGSGSSDANESLRAGY